jgi:hypothetical protein
MEGEAKLQITAALTWAAEHVEDFSVKLAKDIRSLIPRYSQELLDKFVADKVNQALAASQCNPAACRDEMVWREAMAQEVKKAVLAERNRLYAICDEPKPDFYQSYLSGARWVKQESIDRLNAAARAAVAKAGTKPLEK